MARESRQATNVGPGLWKGAGMWAWILHRITGLVIVAYLFAHIVVVSRAQAGAESFNRLFETLESPLFIILDLVLLAAVVYHCINGIRVLLFDLGIGIRRHKQLFYAVLGVAAAFMVVFAVVSFSFIA